jgi:hypothetical protein
MVGGALIAGGSVLPWASVRSGLGTLTVLASFLRYGGNAKLYVRVAIAAIGALVLVLAVDDALSLRSPVTVGAGLFVVMIGALGSIVSVGRGTQEKRPPA